MTIAEYLFSVKERLLSDPAILCFQIARERATQVDGHLRVRLSLTGGTQLEFSEYVQLSPDGNINVVTYSYQWAGSDNSLIRRWDNTPHFPNLLNFPHHIHDGLTGRILPGRPVNIFVVLDEIIRLLP